MAADPTSELSQELTTQLCEALRLEHLPGDFAVSIAFALNLYARRQKLPKVKIQWPAEGTFGDWRPPDPRGNRDINRYCLRMDVFHALTELNEYLVDRARATGQRVTVRTGINVYAPAARRGKAGKVLMAVLQEADRLDGRRIRGHDVDDLQLSDWKRWVADFSGEDD